MKLDYSALNRSVTRSDIEAYYAASGKRGYSIREVVLIPFFLFLLMSLPLIFTAFVDSGESLMSTVLWIILVPGGFSLVFCLIILNSWMKERGYVKLYAFALSNDLEMMIDERNPSYAGAIFGSGRDRSITEALFFHDGIEIGNYTYTTGHGRSQQEYHWGYVRVRLNRLLPHMLLDAKSNNFMKKFSNLPDLAAKDQVLSLEGNFDKFFTLYVPNGYERDALYVFTPDVMHALISVGAAYDIEVIDNYLMFYQNGRFQLDKPDQYKTLFSVIDKIASELHTQANRYKDERAYISSGDPIAHQGRRLNKNMKVSIYFIIGVGILLVTMQFISIFLSMPRM